MADRMVDQTAGNEVIPYRPIVIAIHWASAVLILSQIWVGLSFADMPKGPVRDSLFAWHKTVGVAILLLAILRLMVRLTNSSPAHPESMARWEQIAAVWNERIMYLLTIGLPLTGLMLASKGGPMTTLKWGLSFPTIPLAGIGDSHSLLAWGLIVLLAIHVLAALKHQFVDRDGVVGRMIPFLRKN